MKMCHLTLVKEWRVSFDPGSQKSISTPPATVPNYYQPAMNLQSVLVMLAGPQDFADESTPCYLVPVADLTPEVSDILDQMDGNYCGNHDWIREFDEVVAPFLKRMCAEKKAIFQKTARVVIPHGYSVTRVVMLCIGGCDSYSDA